MLGIDPSERQAAIRFGPGESVKPWVIHLAHPGDKRRSVRQKQRRKNTFNSTRAAAVYGEDGVCQGRENWATNMGNCVV